MRERCSGVAGVATVARGRFCARGLLHLSLLLDEVGGAPPSMHGIGDALRPLHLLHRYTDLQDRDVCGLPTNQFYPPAEKGQGADSMAVSYASFDPIAFFQRYT